MIPSEWLETYFKKSGDRKLYPTEYSHICDKGFASWNVTADALMVVQLYGDGRWWHGFFDEMAGNLGLPIRFATTRNPKAWERKYGAKVVGYIMEVETWAG